MGSKSILFLSGIDFKDKSIQVIRKTPEAFVNSGWQVSYMVMRDMSRKSNYYYEPELNPEGVNVIRYHYPMKTLIDKAPSGIMQSFLNKVKNIYAAWLLYRRASKIVDQNNFDVIYGYEHIGTLAAKLMKSRFGDRFKYISRFQGTWLTMFYKEGRKLKYLWNFETIWAMKFKSDLAIMTDDGTQGDFIFKLLNPDHKNSEFWTNGVDLPVVNASMQNEIENLIAGGRKIILSVSRLVGWKKVERVLEVMRHLKELDPSISKKVVYLVVGEGANRKNLEDLSASYGLTDMVYFQGAVSNTEVPNYMAAADFFFSLYDLSNVGNPLLESIRANNIIFTLDNGATSEWITHRENGFIYDHSNIPFAEIAKDLLAVINDVELCYQLKKAVKVTETEKLRTWTERLAAEEAAVSALLD